VNHVLDKDPASVTHPWHQIMSENKDLWQNKNEKGEIEIEPSGASEDTPPPPVVSITSVNGDAGGHLVNGDANINDVDHSKAEKAPEEPKFKPDNLDNRHLIKQIGPISITSKPPSRPTRHRDVIQHMSTTIISRPGSPVNWDFGVKESITTGPPRPTSASLLSPPEKRRAPISVDHTLRKHALDFS